MVDSQTIYLKNLSEVMEEYKPVYQYKDWDDAMRQMLSNETDYEIIEELKHQYLKTGKFREPIVLYCNDGIKEIADGTHRIIASFIIGAEKILVSEGYPTLSTPNSFLVTSIKYSSDTDMFDKLIDSLMSFPLNDDIWVTSDLASGQKAKKIELYWTTNDESISSMITEEINRRIEKHFPELSFSTDTFLDTFEDDEDDDDVWKDS